MDFTLNADKIAVRSARGDTDHAIGTGFENMTIGGLVIDFNDDGYLRVDGKLVATYVEGGTLPVKAKV